MAEHPLDNQNRAEDLLFSHAISPTITHTGRIKNSQYMMPFTQNWVSGNSSRLTRRNRSKINAIQYFMAAPQDLGHLTWTTEFESLTGRYLLIAQSLCVI
jgi:hypothetical protein